MTGPQRIRAALRSGFEALSEFGWYRRPASRLMRGLVNASTRVLLNSPSVSDVYLRGSYARGTFKPLASDVDLAVFLRDDAGRSWRGVAEAAAALRKARRRNPWIRDWWQHMILESERSVVEAFCPLFGAAGWRSAAGGPSFADPAAFSPRLLSASAWYQLCAWSGSVFHAFLYPSDPVHNLRAGLAKARTFAARLGVPGDVADPAGVYAALDRAARIVAGERSAGHAAPERRFRTAQAAFVVWEDGLSHGGVAGRLEALKASRAPASRVTYVLPASALAAWPLPADPIVEGEAPGPMEASLAREVYLHEALFLPSSLRLSAASPGPARRLAASLRGLRRAARIYGASVDDADPAGDEAMFADGVRLADRLNERLLALAADARGSA